MRKSSFAGGLKNPRYFNQMCLGAAVAACRPPLFVRRSPGSRDVSMTQVASKVVGRGAGGRSRAIDVDPYVSLRIRQRRIMLGLTQQQMAELIGVTYQQAHKYETGINRISAGRLYQIAQALGVEISYFFEDVEPERRG